ncbi:LPXTG cell wall anchor domain-containing protein [Bifidobacterium stellenboschense]|uniref:Acid shock protein n=1 Tax=Bifidobacterium stellenboschense TaxID=762211 RepID=A0A087D8P3_9BIFI|nr:LPXTG cell wall anchor domain-containing protein [Bifidobacterium stellenboschense]KFI91893.1 acid shock protein [Bifidobacterium stellenboschense]
MKHMGKVAAIIAAASMLLTGVGTAYADDAAGVNDAPAAATQQDGQSGQADAGTTADQSGATDGTDGKSDATQQNGATADQSGKTDEQPKADVKAATPQSQAKAAASGAAIASVDAPQGVLKAGVSQKPTSKPTFKVSLTGLTAGKTYGVASNLSSDSTKPKAGDQGRVYNTPSYGDGANTVFTATGATTTVELTYEGANIASAWFALLESDKGIESNEVEGVYTSVVDKTVDVVNLPGTVTLGRVQVEDVGQHTAGLKAHYTIDPKIIGDVTKICLATTVVRAYTLRGKFTANVGTGGEREAWDCTTGYVDDKDDTTGTAYRVMNMASWINDTQTLTGQWFSRGSWKTPDAGETLPESGDITSTIVGLNSGTKYGNWGYEGNESDGVAVALLLQSQTTVNDPMSMMYSGLALTFSDGSMYVGNGYHAEDKALQNVPDFTTQPATAAESSDKLTDANRNGVIGANDGKATAGSTYRLYVDSLQDTAACKASVADNQYCYWAGYIYSDPKRLASADGTSSAVRVDENNKAYVEYTIPADYTGAHKIAVYDDSGNLLGWAPVTVGKAAPGANGANGAANGAKLSNTGAATDMIATAAAALLLAGAGLVTFRRRHA